MAFIPEIVGGVEELAPLISEESVVPFVGRTRGGGPIYSFDPEVAPYYQGRSFGLGVREGGRISRGVQFLERATGISAVASGIDWLKKRFFTEVGHGSLLPAEFDKLEGSRKKQKMASGMEIVTLAPAVPSYPTGKHVPGQWRRAGIKFRGGKFEKALQRTIPLSMNVLGNINSPLSFWNSTASVYATLNMFVDSAGAAGTVGDPDMAYNYSMAPFGGVGPNGGRPAYEVSYGLNSQLFGWGQFISFSSNQGTVFPDKSWLELNFERLNIVYEVPQACPKFHMEVIIGLVPLVQVAARDIVTGQVTLGEGLVQNMLGPTSTGRLFSTFGRNFFGQNVPTRLFQSRDEMMVLKRFILHSHYPTIGAQALVGLNTASTDIFPESGAITNYLMPAWQQRYQKSIRFRYGSSGLRFYVVTNATAGQWIPWISAGAAPFNVFFLGSDRTTPVIPFRCVRYWTDGAAPGMHKVPNLGAATPGAPDRDFGCFSMHTNNYTWYRVERPGALSNPTSSAGQDIFVQDAAIMTDMPNPPAP